LKREHENNRKSAAMQRIADLQKQKNPEAGRLQGSILIRRMSARTLSTAKVAG
jgi:hypothetical protein